MQWGLVVAGAGSFILGAMLTRHYHLKLLGRKQEEGEESCDSYEIWP